MRTSSNKVCDDHKLSYELCQKAFFGVQFSLLCWRKMDKCTRNEGSLPSEMIYEVFLRLPARSLGRFKCVSKLWLSTISDPQFISSHLDLSRARPKLLISLPSYGVEALMFSADYPEPGNEIMEQGQPHQTLMAEFHGLVLKGDANVEYIGASQASGGLICFGFRSDVTICNPVTGETINHRLPRFPTHSFVKNHFGYDPVEKKYKVLSTWSDITQNCGSFVFTLGEEGWRRLEDYHPTIFRGCTHDDELRSAGVCINGVIYYISYYMEDVQEWGYFHLAAFDLQSETFEVIPLPDKNFGEGMLFLKESAGGSVAVFRLPHILDENNEDDEESDLYNEVEVYTLKDKDLRTWSYECFPVPEGWSGVVVDNFLAGTSHKGELLFVRRIDSGKLELYIYEAETGNRRHTEVHGLHEYECEENSTGSFIRVGDHMETLKSLKGL